MREILRKVKRGALEALDSRVYSEAELRAFSRLLDQEPTKSLIVSDLITNIPRYGRSFDWNVGSILQHLEAEITIGALQYERN